MRHYGPRSMSPNSAAAMGFWFMFSWRNLLGAPTPILFVETTRKLCHLQFAITSATAPMDGIKRQTGRQSPTVACCVVGKLRGITPKTSQSLSCPPNVPNSDD
jgi:hypothetical protein